MNQTETPTPAITLSTSQIKHLRGLGHHLEPVVMIGKEGVTAAVLSALEANLLARELVKVKLQQASPLERNEAAELLSREAGATLVQILGRTILLYRANQDLVKEKRIAVPPVKKGVSKRP